MNLEEVSELVENAEAILGMIKEEGEKEEYLSLLGELSKAVNRLLYHTESPDVDFGAGIRDKICSFIPLWKESIRFRMEEPELDVRFFELYEVFKFSSKDVLVNHMKDSYFRKTKEERLFFLERLKGMVFLDGSIDEKTDDYSLMDVYAETIKKHVDDLLWLYEMLGDNRSREVLVRIAEFWLSFDEKLISEARETLFFDYYDLDLVEAKKGDVFVDCGAFVGDSIVGYIKAFGAVYGKIYAYEMVDKIYNLLIRGTSCFRDIVYRKVGVSAEQGEMFLANDEYDDAACLSDNGQIRVETVTLDDDIKDCISMIKMDIEGAEMDALEGARGHITNEKPQLLISAYHKPDHIFEIPKRILEYRGDYKIYLRYNGKVVWPADFILIAV